MDVRVARPLAHVSAFVAAFAVMEPVGAVAHGERRIAAMGEGSWQRAGGLVSL
jgi:hypothetical protein